QVPLLHSPTKIPSATNGKSKHFGSHESSEVPSGRSSASTRPPKKLPTARSPSSACLKYRPRSPCESAMHLTHFGLINDPRSSICLPISPTLSISAWSRRDAGSASSHESIANSFLVLVNNAMQVPQQAPSLSRSKPP